MNESIIKREKEALFQTYKRLPIVVEKAIGCNIYDKNGNEYLDMLGGIAVNSLGHSHPEIKKAIAAQAERYMHLSNYFYQDIQIELAEKLKKLSSYARVFFSNSGTEAVEGAIKLTRRLGSKNGKHKMLAFSGGFHGRTYGALSLMDKPHYKDGMGPFLDNMSVISYNDSVQLENSIDENTAGIILEFLQGEGGISAADESFVKKIFELKNKFNFLVIADEIQAGAGRTGDFFSFEKYGVKPDVVTLAKGVGGGLPLGVILGVENLEGVWEPAMHGTTFGGNALACAAGKAVLDAIDSGLMEHVKETGAYLNGQLKNIQREFPEIIKEVRGRGMMQGLLLSFDASKLVAALLERKVIANAASGTVLRLVPPLIITKEEIDTFISALKSSLKVINN